MIQIKNAISGRDQNDNNDSINSFGILLELRDLLCAINGKIDSNYLWQFIQKKSRENEDKNIEYDKRIKETQELNEKTKKLLEKRLKKIKEGKVYSAKEFKKILFPKG